MKIITALTILAVSLLLASCSSSTGGRYGKEEDRSERDEEKVTEEKPAVDEPQKTFEEDFNLTPYRAELDIEYEESLPEPVEDLEIWYGYEQADTVSGERRIVDTGNGYRVQVIATDDLEEANDMKAELYFKTNQKNVYVVFDPPFYKVKVGDFSTQSDANTLNFKLNQMGYTESRVVQDTINIYE